MSEKQRNRKLAATTERIRAAQAFLAERDPSELSSAVLRHSVYLLRFLYVLGREARADLIWQRAAALTYTTILTLFPLLILLTSMGSVFYTKEQETQLIDFVEKRLLPPPDAGMLSPLQEQERDERLVEIQTITGSIRQMSETYRASAPRVGFLGFLALLVTGYILYQSIESSFEAAWGETHRRANLRRSVTGFTFLVVFAPVIIGGSVTASSFLVSILGEEVASPAQVEGANPNAAAPAGEGGASTPADAPAVPAVNANAAPAADQPTTPTTFRGRIAVSGAPAPAGPDTQKDNFRFEPQSRKVAGILLSLLPFLLNSILLALAYVMIPRTKVKFRYALLGGLTAGLLWELAKVGFFYYIYLSAARRQMIRTLGAVPIFLVWIYFTWIVFLLGNHLVYVSQNLGKLYRQYFGNRLNSLLDGQVFVGVALMVADAFMKDERGVSMEDLTLRLRLPYAQLEEVVRLLRQQGTVTSTEDGLVMLAHPPSHVPVRDLLALGCDVRHLCAPDEWRRRPNVGSAVEQMAARRDRRLRHLTLEDLLEGRVGPGASASQVEIPRLDELQAPAPGGAANPAEEAQEDGQATDPR